MSIVPAIACCGSAIPIAVDIKAANVRPRQGCPNPNWSIALLHITFTNVVLHLVQNGFEVLTFNFGNVDL
ncbi:MAG: hypothetical protein WCA39_18270 [Nitrososphaeraceae archaeon]